MKLLLKLFSLATLVAIAFRSTGQDYIRIENIGPTFKYSDILLVSNGKIPDTFSQPTTNVYLDSSAFGVYKSIINRYLPKTKHVKHIVFGTFEVDIRKSENMTSYYMLIADRSLLFFKSVLTSLKKTTIDQRILYTLDSYVKMLGG